MAFASIRAPEHIYANGNGKCWIVSRRGDIIYTNDVRSSTWHEPNGLADNKYDPMDIGGNIDDTRMVVFDQNHAFTYYDKRFTKTNRNGMIYASSDAGLHWQRTNAIQWEPILGFANDSLGHAWMGGIEKQLYYTADYGLNWQLLPLKTKNAIVAITMHNANTGVLAGDYNELLMTSDNWQSAKHIPTPFDQLKIKKGKGAKYIQSLMYWGDLLVISQSNRLFYSNVKIINWKEFKIIPKAIKLDNRTKILYGFTGDNKLIVFDKGGDYKVFGQLDPGLKYIDMLVNNGEASILLENNDDEYLIGVIRDGKKKQYGLFTSDYPIPKPENMVKDGVQSWPQTWGANGQYLYHSTDSGGHWIRYDKLPFMVSQLGSSDKNRIEIVDSKYDVYSYQTSSKKLSPYSPHNLLDSFFRSDIKAVDILYTSSGCFHNIMYALSFEVLKDGKLKLKDRSFDNNIVVDSALPDTSYKLNVSIKASVFKEVLQAINADPLAIPKFSDFNISQFDIDEAIKRYGHEQYNSGARKTDIEKLKKPDALTQLHNLQIADSVFANEIFVYPNGWSTTTQQFFFTVYNQDSESVMFHQTGSNINSAKLPLLVEYRHREFKTYSLPLSKAIDQLLPNDFPIRKNGYNAKLVLILSKYLK